MNTKFKKILCILISVTMIFSLAACDKTDNSNQQTDETKQENKAPVNQVSYKTAAKNVKKSETVYVNLDPEGNVTNKVVTDWLHTDTPETYIDDVTDLENIQNVKSDIQPVSNKDGSIRWNMETTDLYYRGETKKDLPVNFKISYYLDGKETSAEDIAGKNGQVKMVVTMTNESSKEVTVNGKKTTMYTPFICAGGMILEENSFSNITVENGKTIGDGTKEIALLIGTPGLKESLNLSDELLEQLGDFDFTSTYTITLDTEKFELSNMIFAVIPLSSVVTEINNTLPGTVDDVKTQLSKVQAIIDKFNSMNVTELVTKLFSNTDQLTELTSSIGKVTQVYNDNKALLDVLEKYMTEENLAAIKTFIDDSKEIDYEQVAEILSNPILQRFFKELPTLSKDMQDVMPIINGLSTDLEKPEVQKALNNLPQTIATLKELKKAVDDNQELFDTLGDAFDDETIASLQEMMNSLDEFMDENTLKKYTGLLDNADDLIARAEEWVKLGQEYDCFTTAQENTQTSVMFVYETSPITAKEEKKEPVSKDDGKKENAIKTWFKQLFKKDN